MLPCRLGPALRSSDELRPCASRRTGLPACLFSYYATNATPEGAGLREIALVVVSASAARALFIVPESKNIGKTKIARRINPLLIG